MRKLRVHGGDLTCGEVANLPRCNRIAGLDSMADDLVRRKAEVDDQQASTLLEALRAVLAELEDASEPSHRPKYPLPA